MEKAAHVRNPLEWAATHVGGLAQARPPELALASAATPVPRHITTGDLRAALRDGWQDFLEFRSDVIVLCFMYPLAGAVLWRFATGYNLLHLVFPLVAGFALVGPLFATGLYEMSRQRERGMTVNWATAFAAFRSSAIIRIAGLGVVLLALFAAWLLAAQGIYNITLHNTVPDTAAQFTHDVLFTSAGHVMALIGVAVGFCFAAATLCCSVISFPLLLDRTVTVQQAVGASIATFRANPRVMAIWGLIVAGGLAIGAAPFLVGLIITVPVLGHATWHLYRRVIG